ncbi:MAG: protein kinase [Methylococcales bacterium]|jgi:eukaryotic-like serine/threonine-protein kinase|nr:protein kinase [Methylococcales bacterium]MBT7444889.1 protein kinase [Methylococcales bacterium]
MTLKIFNQVSIKRKLFLILSLSFGFLLAALILLVGEQAEDVANSEINLALTQTEAVLEESWLNRFERISNIAKTIAEDQRVTPLVIEQDKDSLLDLSNELKESSELDILLFVNADGYVLSRTDKKSLIGSRIKGSHHLIDTALTGKEARGFMVSRGKIFQIVSLPVYDLDVNAGDIIRGAIAVAFQVSSDMAARIKKLTTSDIAIYAMAKVDGTVKPKLQFMTDIGLAEALISKEGDIFTRIKQNLKEGSMSRLQLNGLQYHIAVYPLERSGGSTLGYVLAMKSKSDFMKPFDTIKDKILIIGLISLILASIFAWIFSGQITKPVNHLIELTSRIKEGDFKQIDSIAESELSTSCKDEICVLTDSIYLLGEKLRDNEDLQDYLAKISEGLLEDEYSRNLSKEFATEITNYSGDDSLNRSLVIDVESEDSSHFVTQDLSQPLSAKASAVEPDQVTIGQPFAEGRFNIIKELGAGGMGMVYLAHDTGLDETVALKVLFQVDDNQQALLKHEIKLARMITARNVLRTYDYGVVNNQIYISMEYIHGYDLHTLLQRSGGRIDNIRLGVILARQMSAAIASAHEQGIVHRDINPRNMMISSQGILKVMDFGLALQVDNEQETKKIIGTPYYMAPEQIMRQGIDERTDIYQLGAVFYRIFAGTTPFKSIDLRELLQSHLKDPVPKICEKYPEMPMEIDLIVQRAMAKKPQDRYQGIQELQADLQGLNI